MRKRAGPEFARFNDLSWASINRELHVHTNWTDGEDTIEAIIDGAIGRGLDSIALTEHVRCDSDWFAEFAAEVRETSDVGRALGVYLGCEAKALDKSGSLDASPEALAQCDIVLGSVHRFPDGQGGYLNFSTLGKEEMANVEFELAAGLLRTAPIDVLAHPGGMYARRHGDLPRSLMLQIMELSLERGVAIEINSSYVRDFPAFLELCGQINPFISIGSDVHRVERLGHCRDRLAQYGLGKP